MQHDYRQSGQDGTESLTGMILGIYKIKYYDFSALICNMLRSNSLSSVS